MTATRLPPLTRKEWEGIRITDGVKKRIEATIEAGGFQPDPPTPGQLNEWAAMKVMGWHLFAGRWTTTGGHDKFEVDEWQPAQDLGQALECVAHTDYECSWHHSPSHSMYRIAVYLRAGDNHVAYQGRSYDETAIAEAIVRKLHAELGS